MTATLAVGGLALLTALTWAVAATLRPGHPLPPQQAADAHPVAPIDR